MWKHSCALFCALAALLYNTSIDVRTTAEPSTLPLIQFGDLNYIGAFRVPSQSSNGDTFEIGGHPVTYNPVRNSLFMGSRLGKLAEISIPQPVNSADVTRLPRASYLQGFYEPTEGHLTQVPGTGTAVDGILVYGNRLYGTASVYYDANNEQRVSHFSRSLTLSDSSFAGWTRVWDHGKTGFVSGNMALVPQDWQPELGGPAITGQYGIPIVWRTSWGPSAFAFQPTQVGGPTAPATPLLYYDNDHQTLGPWSGASAVYGATTEKGGVAIIAGTRSVLFFGRNGVGPYCYGNGTSNPSLVGTIASDGAHWCYDPTNSAKGPHAYPYRYQIWAYDLNDLAAVRRGTKRPWEVRPYGVWPFALPIEELSVRLTGIGYDSATQTIYVSQMRAEKDGYANRPVVHVLRVGGIAGTPLPQPSGDEPVPTTPPPTTTPQPTPTPPPTTAPPPPTATPSTRVTAVTITPSRAAPQPPGSTIVLTATAVGGTVPLEYQWRLHNDVRWTSLTGWSAANTFSWTPTAANAKYKLSVGVRRPGQASEDISVSIGYPISGSAAAPSPSSRVSSVTVSASRTAPQPPGTTIIFSASPVGGSSPHQYKWRIDNGSTWTTGTWTTSSSYNWTPTAANLNHRVEVWARSSGNTADSAEAVGNMGFPTALPTAAATVPPSAPAPSARATALSMTVSKASPQAPGTAIVMTASPTGGIAPHQYLWSIHDGVKWTTVRTWNTSNTWTWTPAAKGNYRISAHVRSAGRTSEIEEAKATISFSISSSAPPAASPPPTTTAPRATAVTLTSNRTSPQSRGTAVTWTASNVVGGAGPHQYKFYVWNGAASVVARGWSTSNTFTWTPTLASSYYRIVIWVRSSGNTSDTYEASATSPLFAVR